MTSAHARTCALALLVVGAGAACGQAATVGGPPPARILKLASASRQTGRPGQAVGSPPSVRVEDAVGQPLSGVPVVFEVTGGGGATDGAAVSGSDGLARTAWTLGTDGLQTLRASSPRLHGVAVEFSADLEAASSGYQIDLRLTTSATAAQWTAFTHAAARISQLVVGGLPPANVVGQTCGTTRLSETVQNLLILVQIQAIDGAGGVLGQAGPCVVRSGTHLPAVGLMELDSADLARLEANGTLESVILHEMLHVVGFGTVWGDFTPPPLSGEGTDDPEFTGAQALAEAKASNGAPAGWTGVPVEDCGTGSPQPCGAGTRDSHWREPVFGDELMTGWITGSTQPLSATTAASLADLGYVVDLQAADVFDLSAAGLRAPEAPLGQGGEFLGDDVLRGPVAEVE